MNVMQTPQAGYDNIKKTDLVSVTPLTLVSFCTNEFLVPIPASCREAFMWLQQPAELL